jgi:hypothetical protein
VTTENNNGNAKAKRVEVLELKAAPGDDIGAIVAQVTLQPTAQAALTVQSYSFMEDSSSHASLNALVAELSHQCGRASGGDLGRAETILMAQAHTLDAIFGNCARRAAVNLGEHLSAAELYLRLALKAQSQCRATLETLAAIKNPASVAFVRQANISAGPQQVNNGTARTPDADASRARRNKDQQNKLSRGADELLPNTRASKVAGGVDSQMEAVGAINGTENRSR